MSSFRCRVLLFILIFLTACLCEITHVQENKYLVDLIQFLNKVPNKPYIYEDGVLLNAQRNGENIYKIVAKIKVTDKEDSNKIKYVICKSTIEDVGDQSVVVRNDYQCTDILDDDNSQFAGNLEEVVKDPVTSTETVLQDIPPALQKYETDNYVEIPGEEFTNHVDPNKKVIAKTKEGKIIEIQNSETKKYGHITDDEIKKDQEQIIKLNELKDNDLLSITSKNEKHITKTDEVVPNRISTSAPSYKEEYNRNTGSIDDEKIKVIDDIVNFFNFAGFNPTAEKDIDDISKMRRNFDSDLQVMSLQEKFYKLKKHILNAKLLFTLGQVLVDYLNEMDMEVKTRVLNDILAAEEEYEGNQNFFYIKARVNIPCEKAECFTNDTETKICNGVLEDSNLKNPKVLSAFCYKDDLKNSKIGIVKEIPFNDPILQKIVNEAVKKIDDDLKNANALKPIKILSANTQRASGILIKISIIFGYTDCNTSVPIVFRENKCTLLEHLGSKVCDIEVLERHWIREKKLTYNCNERPIDVSFSDSKEYGKIKRGNPNDPVALDIAQDALQYLETESNVNKRQAILKILSITTQIVAGMLTEVEFIVGYTDCEYIRKYSPYAAVKSIKDCKLLQNQQLRTCRARVWERPWLQDGTQFNVTCEFDSSDLNKMSVIRKEKPLELDIPRKRNPNDPKYYKLAAKALKHYLAVKKNNQYHKILKVKDVTTRQISGILTNIQFVISPTNCSMDPNGEIHHSMNCVALDLIVQCTADIMEKPWIDSTLTQVNCSVVSENTPLDFKTTQNQTDKQYKNLAEESLKKVMKTSGISKYYQVLEILEVKTSHTMSGQITKMEFNIAPTSCEIDKNGEPTSSKCYLESSEKFIRCSAVILQKQWLDIKDIDVSCDNSSLNMIKHIENSKFREEEISKVIRKRSVPLRASIEENPDVSQKSLTQKTGGQTIQNASDPKYKALAEESLQKYAKDTGSNKNYQVLKVNKVTIQVVSGTITRIDFDAAYKKCKKSNKQQVLHCHSEIYEVEWENKRDVTIKCDSQTSPIQPVHDGGGSGDETIQRPIGGQTLENANDPKYKELAQESLRKYAEDEGSTMSYQVLKVKKVTSQVVSGYITRIDFDASPTSCQNRHKRQRKSCEILNCHSEIYEKKWENIRDIKINCDSQKSSVDHDVSQESPSQITGGQTIQNASDPKYKSLAEESLQKYAKDTGSNKNYQVLIVNKVTIQVVAGTITRIDFDAAYKKCKKSNKQQVLHCHSEIYEVEWENKRDITIKCDSQTSPIQPVHDVVGTGDETIQRPIGGQTLENANDPKYKELAQESLRKYAENEGTTMGYLVLKVKKVTSQLVSGYITRIDFEAVPEDCPNIHKRQRKSSCGVMYCHSEIYEKKWENIRNISIRCPHMIPSEQIENANDPKYKTLAEESLQKYNEDLSRNGTTKSLELVSIKTVRTLLVSGTLTSIDFEAKPSHCEENTHRQGPSSCELVDCHSKIYECPWENIRNFTVDCDFEQETSVKPLNDVSFLSFVGGKTIENAKDPKFKPMAEESLQKYAKDTGSTTNFLLFEVNKVTTQLVAGFITSIDFTALPSDCQYFHKRYRKSSSSCVVMHCHSEIYEIKWENKKEILVECPYLFPATSIENPKDPIYKSLAEQSVQKYNEDLFKQGITGGLELVRVKIVQTVPVSGTLTTIDFEARLLSCQKSQTRQGQSKCDISVDCRSKIWEKPWENFKQINVSCDLNVNPVKKVSVGSFLGKKVTIEPLHDDHRIGGQTTENPNDPKYRALAEECLQKYQKDIGSPINYLVFKVTKVTTQVVAGTITRIDFKALQSDCPNFHRRYHKQSCVLMYCHSEIYEVPWENKRDLSIRCPLAVPSETVQNANDPIYKSLAEDSLRKYNEDLSKEGKTVSLQLVSVKMVVTVPVSGWITTIDFEARPSTCQKTRIDRRQGISNCKIINCHSKIWECPWENIKNITVNCDYEQQTSADKRDENAKKTTHIFRAKREISNYIEDIMSNPKILGLANKSLEIYNSRSDVTVQYRVKQLTKITQGVSSYKTLLNFEAVPLKCSLKSSHYRKLCEMVLKCYSEILEIPVGGNNKTVINVNCINPREPQYKALAEESLNQYLDHSRITQFYQVTDINDVIVRDSSGLITKINFDVSPASCLLNLDEESVSECYVVNASKKFQCKSEILEQAWLHKKEISVKCYIPHSNTIRLSRQRHYRTEKNPENPVYKTRAEKYLKQYLKFMNDTQQYQLLRVTHIVTQKVAGVKTKIFFDISPTTCHVGPKGERQARSLCRHFIHHCFSDIWERPWLYNKVVIVDCFPPVLSESKVDELAHASLRHYLRSSIKLFVMRRVTHFSSEGFHLPTNVNFEISPTNCSVNEVSSNCEPENEIFTCHSEIKDISSWNKSNINVRCYQNYSNSNVPYENELNAQQNYSKYYELAKISMKHYYLMHGQSQHYEIVRIKRVTSFDENVKIYFDISPTNCSLDGFGNLLSPTCKIVDANKKFDCHSEVKQGFIYTVERNNTKVISVNCNFNEQSRVKREVLVEKSTEKHYVSHQLKVLAEESLQKYLETSSNHHGFKIIEILRATTKTISGTLTSLDFTISPTNCSLNATEKLFCSADNSKIYRCLSNVWERPWLKDDAKLIAVECNNSDDLSLLNEHYEINDVNYEIERVIRSVKPSIKSGASQDQDASLPKFRKLAKESLNKYIAKKRIGDPHEVVKVNKVVKKVVSGFKYNIDFTAMPKSCYQNSSCLSKETLMLKCNSEIWDRPWLKRKDITVSCRKTEVQESEVSRELVEETYNTSVPLNRTKKDTTSLPNISENYLDEFGEYREINRKDIIKYKSMAEKALQKYESTSLFAYFYKVVEIHRVTERVTGDVFTNIDFSALLTNCQRNSVQKVGKHCKIQEPKIGIRCKAEISNMIPRLDKNIEVKCKNKRFKSDSQPTTESNRDEVVVTRQRRQLLSDDDDYIEEDVKYYYAERALYDYNKRSGTNNLFKIVTIHDTDRSYHMKTLMFRMYLEIAMTYCLRNEEEKEIQYCDEVEPLSHKLCLARIYPTADDEMIIRHATMVCNDDIDFQSITGLSVKDLVKASIAEIEKSPDVHYRLAHMGEANLVPTLTYSLPMRLSFLAVTTNCTKDVDLEKHAYRCWVDDKRPTSLCTSYIYLIPNTRDIHHMDANCRNPPTRFRRDISTNPNNATTDDLLIQQMVQEAIEKLEMSSLQRYKQRVLLINSYSTKITTGKVTTVDFDVGYTNCLKFEWVENVTSCEFIEHLPRRHCVATFMERLWIKTSKSIDVNCEDDETPLEAHIEFESAENAMHLAKEALRHIEAKYPSPQKQKVVRIFSLEKQTIAGLHYRLKVEVGLTDCVALSIEENCKLVSDPSTNKFCRINVWVRPWTDHPPNYRVSCDYQEDKTTDIYHEIQAEHLFFDFLTRYKPNYQDNFGELKKRYTIFKDNVRKIHELNIYERGTAKYAVTRFADLTYEEFGEKYLGLKVSLRNNNHTIPMADIPKVELPDKFDWRDFDAVTEVKDQGACGSCWAFSVTGNIEGQWKMQSGQLVSLSEQELVDCDKLDNGCSGGLPDNAYRAIEQLGGLEAENDYPYEGVNDKCSFNKTLTKVQITGAVNISSNETDMAKWLVQNGPISIGINANAMQFYVGGVSHPWKVLCNPENLDHGVLIVGYGVKDYPLFHKRLPYWIIKNSWGARWGEQGYYRVYKGDGTCGVNKMASSAVI